LERPAFSGELVVKADGLFEMLARDEPVFFEPSQDFCERARARATKRILEITKPPRTYEKVAHDEERAGIAEHIDDPGDRAFRTQFSPLASGS